MSLTKNLTRIGISTAGLLLLVGCSSPTPEILGATNPATETSSPTYVQTGEIIYMQSMIPHHQQAITMAKYAILNSTSEEVIDLATHIMETQDDEIQLMRQYIQERGGNPDEVSTQDSQEGEMGGTQTGMLTEEELQKLKQTTRDEFDILFLEQMIKHHQTTISLSANVLSQSADDQIRRLAQSITGEQEREIQFMQQLLNERGINNQAFS